MSTILMKLTNRHKVTFTLNIVSYEYETAYDNMQPEDKNWLLIEMNIEKYRLSYKRIDPCLLTSEINCLIKWVADLREYPKEKTIGFAEPCLGFRVFNFENRWYIEPELQEELDTRCILKRQDLWFPFTYLGATMILENLKDALLDFPERG